MGTRRGLATFRCFIRATRSRCGYSEYPGQPALRDQREVQVQRDRKGRRGRLDQLDHRGPLDHENHLALQFACKREDRSSQKGPYHYRLPMKHKKSKRKPPPKRPSPTPEAVRSRLVEAKFDFDDFEAVVGELEQAIEDTDPYWLEGAMELVANSLVHLIDVKDRPRFASGKLSAVLEYVAEHMGMGAEAVEAASSLEDTNSSSWYGDESVESLESARDELVQALMDLSKALRKASS